MFDSACPIDSSPQGSPIPGILQARNPTADSVPVTEREYIAGMYISDVSVATNGKWFLVGDIQDNESIIISTVNR